jgi:hypothetical protein
MMADRIPPIPHGSTNLEKKVRYTFSSFRSLETCLHRVLEIRKDNYYTTYSKLPCVCQMCDILIIDFITSEKDIQIIWEL